MRDKYSGLQIGIHWLVFFAGGGGLCGNGATWIFSPVVTGR